MKEPSVITNIREIFLKDWDPLDVGDNPNLIDEYDAYIPRILKALRNKASESEVAEVLHNIEVDEFGIDPNSEFKLDVAKRLITSWRQGN